MRLLRSHADAASRRVSVSVVRCVAALKKFRAGEQQHIMLAPILNTGAHEFTRLLI